MVSLSTCGAEVTVNGSYITKPVEAQVRLQHFQLELFTENDRVQIGAKHKMRSLIEVLEVSDLAD